MKIPNKALLFAGISFLIFAGTVFASSSASFFTQAKQYVNNNCFKKTISGQTSLICYLFEKTEEYDKNFTTINTIISPIPNQITSLQASTSAISNTVNNLQTTSGKVVKVFDANNTDLGILVDTSPITVFNTTTGMLVPINESGSIGPVTRFYFVSSDCTGTPYVTSILYAGFLISVRSELWKVDTSSAPLTLTVNSNSINGICNSFTEPSFNNLYPLIPATNPYANPIALPLQFKYQ